MMQWFRKPQLTLTPRRIKKLFPIAEWLPKYNLRKLQGDLIAGLAVGLMIIPQSLAHSVIAGLKPQYGLYSSFPAMFVYLFFGTSKDVSIGTTVITALLANRYSITEDIHPEIVAALTFIVGVVLVAVVICQLGFVVRLLSFPIISGFVSASSIIIIASQLRYFLGLKRPPRMIFLKLKYLFENLKNTRPGDATMGIVCLIILILLQCAAKRKWNLGGNTPKWRKILVKIVHIIGIGRNAFIAILAIIISYSFHKYGLGDIFRTVGHLPEGLPRVEMPLRPIKLDANRTIEVKELITGFGSGIAVLPIIIVVQSIAISKSLGQLNKYRVDTFQEIFALGLANIFGSFFNAIPLTVGFSRSAINSNSGSETPVAGVFTSIIVILAIEFVSPVFRFAPMSSLSAIVIAAVINLFDYQLAMKLWRLNKFDLAVWFLTFGGCIYEIEIGIAIGVVMALALILYREFNPRMNIRVDKESRKLFIALQGGVWFPGIGAVASIISRKLDKHGSFIDTVVIDCENMLEIDYTVLHGLHEILADCSLNDTELQFVNVKEGKIKFMLRGDKLLKGGEDAVEEHPLETVETGPLIPNGESVTLEANA